ncbi:SAM-dependent methyltransferase [Micractinium conductrix]|uniref:SAM-dependent methyltransferase n=1 Tax=Micractinium conductrix TaxID=554055 RepID=A0A2P6VLW0_9CHLO|nr:SAM-dependent methyltransferase [Micractinium conductrix]|eukprot:PSC75091.1 SAM-dependent methyltransferase [Micractinium conductrix]
MSLPRSMDTHEGHGAKIVAAAAERNKGPILAVLQEFLGGAAGLVLEVASGTGQHTAHFAAALPRLTFQPSENKAAEDSMASIRAWGQGLPNMRPPMQLDASAPADGWPVGPGTCRAVYAANLTHISPWAATAGLIKGAGRALASGGELFVYGPFSVDGRPTTESNVAFDASLRARNPQWGYRDVADVTTAAAAAGLAAVERREMPANNLMLVFRKQ